MNPVPEQSVPPLHHESSSHGISATTFRATLLEAGGLGDGRRVVGSDDLDGLAGQRPGLQL